MSALELVEGRDVIAAEGLERGGGRGGAPGGDVADVAGPRPAGTAPVFQTFSGDHVPSLDELERAHILRVLELCEGQKTTAAALLRINRTTLWKKLRQYGLDGD